MEIVAIAGLVTSLVGVAGSTLSQAQSVRAASQAAETEAGFREAEARSAEQVAAAEEAQDRRRTERIIAKQRAISAASGIDISSGSPLLQELDAAREAEISALTIRQRGAVQAQGLQGEASLGRFRARAGKRALTGIAVGGGAKAGSILTSWLEPRV